MKLGKAWEQISSEFNDASGNFPRSTKTIRSKYDTIKKKYSQKICVAQERTNKNWWWSVLSNFDSLRGKSIIINTKHHGGS